MPYTETFDGMEGDDAPCTVPCPTCMGAVAFDLWQFCAQARPGWRLSDEEVAKHGLVRRANRGMVATTVTADGPAAFVGSLGCPSCRAEFTVAVGLQEFQPGRWIGGVLVPER